MLDDTLTAPNPTIARTADPPEIRLLALPGVYAPIEDSWLLAEALVDEGLEGTRVLDLCTGSGVLAVTAAAHGADVTAVDVSRRAALSARLNLWRNGLRGRVVRGDLLHAAPHGPYDVIVSNPPYVPAATDEIPRRGRARAWDAGRDGRVVIDRICVEAPARLRPGGRLLMVHSHVADLDRTVDLLREQGLDAGIAVRRRVSFGPVMQARAEMLRRQGLVGTEDEHEHLAVIRAQVPA